MLGTWYIPPPVKDAVKWLVEKIIHIAESVIHTIEQLLEGVAMPFYLFDYSWNWEDIKGTATGVASEITPEHVTVKGWEGQAAAAYSSAIQPQSQAAAQLGAIASSTATSLLACAAAGLAFYVALGIIVFQLIHRWSPQSPQSDR
jgi:uncharacterized protein YukE